MEQFSITDQILNQSSKSTQYRSTRGMPKRSIHWGQRKLLLTEIQFLVNYWDIRSVPNPVIVYAGAAPGIHIPLLSRMFPSFIFYLYDPQPFAIKGSSTINIYNQKFTNEDAKKWANKSNVFFI